MTAKRKDDTGHTTVMLDEVLEILAARDDGIYVDGTFGVGGVSRALLEQADCRVWGIDRDPEAVARGRALAESHPGRFEMLQGRFGEMDRLMADRGAGPADGITLDLGVSSPQIDQPGRGFSFRQDGPLDMRMEGPEAAGGPSAADVVNTLPESDLADVIYRYGEERKSRPIARAIAAARREAPITRTLQLAEIVRRVLRRGQDGQDPATRTFQALRIYVNDELGELERGLSAAERLLAPGGRLAVIAFHSLEDRAVKSFLSARSGNTPRGSRHLPEAPGPNTPAPTFRPLTRGVRRPGQDEIAANPRARSARLRAAERTAAPAWSGRPEGAAP